QSMEFGAVLVWLLAFALLTVLGLPVVARLFPDWPTRGVGFALPVTLLVMGVVAFWVGRVAFGVPALIAGLLVAAGLAVALGVDWEAVRAADGRPTTPEVRAALTVDPDWDRRAVGETVAVFLLAFGFMVAVRAADPAIFPYAGEKFLDFGLVKSLLRGDTLPPEDMWFAGEPVRYYYGGHMLTALLTLLTGTTPAVAYNLALAAFFAMYVTAAFDLAGAAAVARDYARRPAAFAAAFFVGLGANLQTAAILALEAAPASVRTAALNAVSPSVREGATKLLTGSFSYWSASRVIPGTINEFPLFAFLNGDLHAHMTDTPFLLLAAAVAFALFRTQDTTRRRLLTFGVVPVIGAFQAVINTWSFPTVFGLAWLGLALGVSPPRRLFPRAVRSRIGAAVGPDAVPDGGRPAGLAAELARPVVAAGVVALAGGVAALLASPFLLGAAQAGSSRSLAILPVTGRSSLGGLLVVHGGFLALFGAYLFDRVGTRRPAELLAAVGVLAVASQILGLPALVLVGSVLLVGWIAVRSGRAGFGTVLAVGGAGLVLLVELIFLQEQAGPGRFNTVFKTYAQVWALWAPAAGVAVAGLVRQTETTAWPSLDVRRYATVAVVVLVVASSGAYASQAVPQHFTAGGDPGSSFAFGYPEDPTLNGTAYVERFHPDAARAIRYLDRQPGQPTMLSGPATGRYAGPGGPPTNSRQIGMYRWPSSPAASLTGIPTVAGWAHEVGYRGGEAYFGRVRQVDRAYTNRSAAISVIRQYDVQYVWVGTNERSRYAGELIDFGAIPGVEPVVQTDRVTLYRVDHSELPDDSEEN
ncbi:MAG: DUF2298 domain-containing protein, partial [Halobaculum sp.]